VKRYPAHCDHGGPGLHVDRSHRRLDRLLPQHQLLVFNAALAGAMTTAATLRLANHTDMATATRAFWVIIFLNVSAALSIRCMSRALRTYAERSDEDPLPGLLNRRGLA
jgi:hypothetical protein